MQCNAMVFNMVKYIGTSARLTDSYQLEYKIIRCIGRQWLVWAELQWYAILVIVCNAMQWISVGNNPMQLELSQWVSLPRVVGWLTLDKAQLRYAQNLKPRSATPLDKICNATIQLQCLYCNALWCNAHTRYLLFNCNCNSMSVEVMTFSWYNYNAMQGLVHSSSSTSAFIIIIITLI